jgi:signal transduction histidine kinase
MKCTRWFLFAVLLATAMTSSGQRASNWRVYKAADGLPETFTSSISIGPHDHLWVGHPNVEWIGWLDGYQVKAIPAPGIGGSRVYESPSSQLWTFSGEHLQQYKNSERGWVSYSLPDVAAALRKNAISLFHPFPLCPLRQNHILILLPDELIECDTEDDSHPKTVLIRGAAQSGLKKFSSLAPARDGGLWITGAHGLAKLLNPIRNLKPNPPWQEYLPAPELQIHNLREPFEDEDGGVTVLADSDQSGKQVSARFDGLHWTLLPPINEKIIAAWRGLGKTSWAVTFSSLFELKPGENQFAADEDIFAHRYFDAITQSNGVFWLAASDGLFRYAPLAWRAPATGPSNNPVSSLAEGSGGRLWALSGQTLSGVENNLWTNYSLPAGITTDSTDGRLFVLSNRNVVLSIGDHLLQFDPRTSAFSSISNAPETRLKPLGLLASGNLCFQSLSADTNQPSHLEIFDGKNFSPFPIPPPDPPDNYDLIFSAQNGDVWLSGKNGLVRYNGVKWQTFPVSPKSSAETPSCMIELASGKIWCGLQDSILQFDGSSWSAVRAGFYRVNSLLHARDGSVWVGSENGLQRFYHGAWIANDEAEGLPSTSVRQVYEDGKGRIWAATGRGLSRYHPDADPDPPQTYVDNLAQANNSAPEGSIVTVSFSAQDKWKYTDQDRLLYSYQLDGQDWSAYQEQRSASFLDLPAGKHFFYVRSMDRNWNMDPKPALLSFTITVPWYRESRLMFISSVGLATVIFFAGLAFNRHRQLLRSYAEVEAKVALRTQQLDLANRELFHSQKMNALGTLAAGIAHDFNNILSIIKGSAQIIEDNLDQKEKIRTRADRIKTVVEQGAGIVRAMLGFSRVSGRDLTLCDVNSIVRDTITLLGDRFLRETEVKFTPSAAPLPEVPASRDFLQQILLNFIFNAAEAMTQTQRVILMTAQAAELPAALVLKPATASAYVFVRVRDFGSGIAPEIMPRIFEPFFTTKSLSVRRGTGLGLSMVYELARQMDAGLSVESTVGQGSTFTLIIPVRPLPVPEKTDNLNPPK